MESSMFLGASHIIFKNARDLRFNQTETEKILWTYLQQRPKGYKFRRQHPLKTFVADFYCHALKLIIEVDGGIHLEKEVEKMDAFRQQYLESEGISFLRFTNEEIEMNIEKVKNKIEEFLINEKY